MESDNGVGTPPPGVVGIEWEITSIFERGQPVHSSDPARPSVLRFDGHGGFSTDACNTISGSARFEGATILFSWAWMTAMACTGEIAVVEDLIRRMTSGTATWSISSAGLHLDSDQVSADLRPLDSPWPRLGYDVVPLRESTGDGTSAQYQVGWTKNGTYVELVYFARDAPGEPWATGNLPVIPPYASTDEMFHLWVPLGAQRIVIGVLPPGASRAVLRPDNGPPIELRTFDVAGLATVYIDVVDTGAGSVDIVALSPTGSQIAVTRSTSP